MSKPKKDRKKNKSKPSGSEPGLRGRLDITRSGMGFVIVDNLEQDILIRPNDFNTAMHGDTVEVRVVKPAGRNGRLQGAVTKVLERKQQVFMGKLNISKNFAFFLPEGDKPMPDIYIPLSNTLNAPNGARVMVKMTEW